VSLVSRFIGISVRSQGLLVLLAYYFFNLYYCYFQRGEIQKILSGHADLILKPLNGLKIILIHRNLIPFFGKSDYLFKRNRIFLLLNLLRLHSTISLSRHVLYIFRVNFLSLIKKRFLLCF
jgi:hypothetical protein